MEKHPLQGGILERSRKENKTLGDERERGLGLLWRYFGFLGTVIACAVVTIVRACLEDALPYEVMAIMFPGLAVETAVDIFITENKDADNFDRL